MTMNYYTLPKESIEQVEIKKSKFIGYAKGVSGLEEAQAYLASIKKLHPSANHHCSAFRVIDNVLVERCDDDREPSKTAGPPILSCLQGLELVNVVAIVVRYFGGTLLGTGGLVKAYTEATNLALKANDIVYKRVYDTIRIVVDYSLNDRLEYELGQREIKIASVEYTDKVTYRVFIEDDYSEKFINEIMSMTSANVNIDVIESKYGYYYNGDLVW